MDLSLCFDGLKRRSHVLACNVMATCGLIALSSGAAAVEYRIDQLSIERNGTAIFLDDYADGIAPPVGTTFINSPTAGYSGVVGNFAGEELNGKLTLDPSHRGVATINPFTGQPEGLLFQAAYLNVNTQSTPDTAGRGLKLHHTFTVSAIFDLVTPGPTTRFDSYGLRLADFDNTGPAGWNDVLDLQVFKDAATGAPKLGLFDRDFRGSTQRLETALLDPALGDQVELTFTKAVADDPTVSVSYRYWLQGAAVGAAISFSASASLFNGEIFTRPGIFAVAAAVPEPETWAMLIAGLSLMVAFARGRPART
jgi:hypothetical protein